MDEELIFQSDPGAPEFPKEFMPRFVTPEPEVIPESQRIAQEIKSARDKSKSILEEVRSARQGAQQTAHRVKLLRRLRTKPVEELANDPEFDRPTATLNQIFEDAEPADVDKLAEVFGAHKKRGVLDPKTLSRFASSIPEIPGAAADVVRGAVEFFPTALKAAGGTSDRKEMLKSQAELTAAVETEATEMTDLLWQSLKKASTEEPGAVGQVLQDLALPGPLARGAAKFARLMGRSTDGRPEMEKLRSELFERAAFEEQQEKLPQALGELAQLWGRDAETLAEQGVEVDVEKIERISETTDLTNLLPAFAGFKVVKMGNKWVIRAGKHGTVASAPTQAAAEAAHKRLGNSIVRAGQKIAGEKTASLRNVGGSAAMGTLLANAGDFIAPGTGAALGAFFGGGTTVARQIGGKAVQFAGRSIASDAAPARFLRSASDAVTRGTAAGAATSFPFAYGALYPEDQALIAGVGGLLGAGGGAAGGVTQAGQNALTERKQTQIRDAMNKYMEASRAFNHASENRPVRRHTGYASGDTLLENQHQQIMAYLEEADPNAANMVNRMRAIVGAFDPETIGELYLLDPETFASKVDQMQRQVSGRAATQAEQTARGVADPTRFEVTENLADGSAVRRMYVRFDASKPQEAITALWHEPGHFAMDVLPPDVREAFKRDLLRVYGEQGISEIGAEYDRLAQVPTGTHTPDYILNELAAENVTGVLRGTNLEGVPPSIAMRAAEASAIAMERLGLAEGFRPSDIFQEGDAAVGGLNFVLSPDAQQAVAGHFRSPEVQDRIRAALAEIELPPATVPTGETAPPPIPTAGRLDPRRHLVAPREATPPAQPAPAQPQATPAAAAPAETPESRQSREDTVKTLRALGVRAQEASDLARQAQETLGTEAPVEELVRVALRREFSPQPEAQPEAPTAPATPPPVPAATQPAPSTPATPVEPSIEPARAAVAANPKTTPEQRAAFDVTVDNLQKPVTVAYRGADKTIVPTSFRVTKGGDVQIIGTSEDKILGKARELATSAAQAKRADLIPYATDDGKIEAGVKDEFLTDLHNFLQNQANGFRGDGFALTRPEGFEGFIPEPTPGYTPVSIPEGKANFLNMILSVPPPKTTRTPKGQTPGNVQARQLREAQGLQMLEPGDISARDPEKQVFEDFGGVSIGEPNPLRREFQQAGIDIGRTVGVERLNLSEVSAARPAPESGMAAQVPAVTAAGFLPAADSPVARPGSRPVTITARDGSTFNARFDGYQDFSMLGQGMVPQITALEDIPGVVPKHSTTYSTTLASAGYSVGAVPRLSEWEAARGEQPAQRPSMRERLRELEEGPKFLPSPDENIRGIADRYAEGAGISYTPFTGYIPVSEELAKRVADAYESAEHRPTDPEVAASYDALASETVAQWNFIESEGYTMEPWTQEGQPYADSREMLADVRDNNHLWFFLTDQGFGTGQVSQHPMLEPAGVSSGGRELLVNDVFRAVHDFFGHAKEGYEFGPRGELNAYLAHSRMFSETANPALAAETLGQNSWVNFGQHVRRPDGAVPKKGQPGFVPPQDRPFAEQKATVLPSELVQEVAPAEEPQFLPADPSKDIEQVQSAAVRLGDRVVTGAMHPLAYQSLIDQIREETGAEPIQEEIQKTEAGFVTTEGRFLSREEAFNLAEQTGQIRTEARRRPEQPLETIQFERDKILAAAPALSEFNSAETLPGALEKPGWAIVTATVEDLGAGTDPVNVRRNESLEDTLRAEDLEFVPVRGSYKGVDQGRSFLVTGVTAGKALSIGKIQGQESVLTHEGLVYIADDTVNPTLPGTTAVGDAARRLDFYSEIEGGPAFSVGIDFDTRVPSKELQIQGTPAFLPAAETPTTDEVLRMLPANAAPTYFSQLRRTVESKVPNKATPAQVLATLRNPQNSIKAEEIEWSGVEQFVEGKDKIDKAELLRHLDDTSPVVGEVRLTRKPTGVAEGLVEKTRDDWRREANIHIANARHAERRDDPEAANRSYALAAEARHFSRGAFEGRSQEELLNEADHLLQDAREARERGDNETADRFFELEAQAHRLAEGVGEQGAYGVPKFEKYKLPGGANYTELLLVLPDQEGRNFQSGHWDYPNVLAHIRMDERTDTGGKRILFLEEIQSDWHQEGRRRGYGTYGLTPEQQSKLAELNNLYEDSPGEMTPSERDEWLSLREAENKQGVPDAPFKGAAWRELALKRAIREAAEGGFDAVAWTDGETQVERFDLSKEVDTLTYDSSENLLRGSKDGDALVAEQGVTPESLGNYVGEELAEKLLEYGTLEGEALRVGGHGVRKFYDELLVNDANKLAKKFGARVQKNAQLSLGTVVGEVSGSVAESIIRSGGAVEGLLGDRIDSLEELHAAIEDRSRNPFGIRFRILEGEKANVHRLDITPALRESAVEKGFPQFLPAAGAPQLKPRKPLKHAVKGTLDLVHYSGQPNLSTVDPKFFGKGLATRTDLQGSAKSYFFTRGSRLGQEPEALTAGKQVYTARVDGGAIYNMSADPLDVFAILNREERDDVLKDEGYAGFSIDTADGRKVVALFKPVKVERAGRSPKAAKRAGAGVEEEAASPQFMFAGAGAKGFDAAVAEGRAFTGPYDKLPRFEIFDYPAELKSQVDWEAKPLGEILNHPELFEAYPDLAELPVSLDAKLIQGGLAAAYRPKNDQIVVSPMARKPAQLKRDLLHEVQHAIQQREDFAKGSSPNNEFIELYNAAIENNLPTVGRISEFRNEAQRRYDVSAGEIEANEVERRSMIPPEALQAADRPFTLSGLPTPEEAVLRFMPAPPRKTKEFKKWFGKSKMVDESGKPRVYYHGSFKNFDAFDPEISTPGAYMGPGVYLTSDPEDASFNYADPLGGDVELKIADLANDIEEGPGFDPDTQDAFEMARERLGSPAVYPVVVSAQNPVVVGPISTETVFGDLLGPEGERLLDAILTTLRSEAYAEDVTGRSLSDIQETIFDGREEITAGQLRKVLGGDAFSQVVQELGHDAIIDEGAVDRWKGWMRGGINPGMHHVTVFDPKKVKSVFNSGDFSAETAALRFMPKVPPGTPKPLRDSLRAKVRQAWEAFPEARPLKFAMDAGTVRLGKDGEPIPVKVPYALDNSPLAKNAAKGIRGEQPRREAMAEAYSDALVDFHNQVSSDPAVSVGKDWYRLAREKISKVFGDDSLLFAELLAATSPRTSVDQNFQQALDAYNKFKAGEYSRHVKKYLEGRKKLKSGKLQAEAAKALGQDEVTEAVAMDWWVAKHDLLPRKLNDQKFNANSRHVLRVLAGTWRSEAQGLKAPQFADNLSGADLNATIDVWAARTLHRMGHEGQGANRWRILPENEPGVEDADFKLAQDAFKRAADKLGLSPDDLQAVLWFGEKDVWDKRGWTRGTGAAKSDFHSLLESLKPLESGSVVQTEAAGQRMFGLDPLELRGVRERRARPARTPRRGAEVEALEEQTTLEFLPAAAGLAAAVQEVSSLTSAALDAIVSAGLPQRRPGRATDDEEVAE